MTLWMHVQHRVSDFARWKRVFDSHRELHQAAGMHLEWIRQEESDSNHIFFLFRVEDRERAEAFVADPVSAQAGVEAGVLEGGYCYIRDAVAP